MACVCLFCVGSIQWKMPARIRQKSQRSPLSARMRRQHVTTSQQTNATLILLLLFRLLFIGIRPLERSWSDKDKNEAYTTQIELAPVNSERRSSTSVGHFIRSWTVVQMFCDFLETISFFYELKHTYKIHRLIWSNTKYNQTQSQQSNIYSIFIDKPAQILIYNTQWNSV